MLIPFDNHKVRVTQGFTYGVHNGMDLVGVDSWQLVAIGDGVIRAAVNLDVHYTEPLVSNRTREWGTYIRLDLNDGRIVFYCHMQPNSLQVKQGEYVTKGTPLGIMGNSGYSFGAHCHLEVRSPSNLVTPEINTATYTKIPNEVGVYEDESEDEPMTASEKKAFDELKAQVNDMQKRLAATENRVNVKYAWISSTSGKRDVPAWAKDDVTYLYQLGILKGVAPSGSLDLSYIELRFVVLLARSIKFLRKLFNK